MSARGAKRVLFVNHEESLTGAPRILLAVAEAALAQPERFQVRVVSRRKGNAHKLFSERLPTSYPSDRYPEQSIYERARLALAETKPDVVYANSAETFEYWLAAKEAGIPVVGHLHELRSGLQHLRSSHPGLEEGMVPPLGECADRFICACREIEDILLNEHGADAFRTTVIPEFVEPARVRELADGQTPNLPWPSPIVVACGTAIRRKGADLFIRTAARMMNVTFLWIGATYPDEIRMPLTPNVHFLGPLENPFPYLAAADVFFLPSREDPFPLVALEALALGLPVVGWRWAGGIHEAVADHGAMTEDPSPAAFEKAIRPYLRRTKGAASERRAVSRIDESYSDKALLPKILTVIDRATVAQGMSLERLRPIKLTRPLRDKAAFMHIPKTAGVTMDTAIGNAFNRLGYKRYALPRVSENLEEKTGRLRNFTEDEMMAAAQDAAPRQYFKNHAPWQRRVFDAFRRNGWFIFTFVRHPGDLICSWHHYFGHEHKDLAGCSLEESLRYWFSGPLDWIIPDYWQEMDFIREFNEPNARDLMENYLGLPFEPLPRLNASENRGFVEYCRDGLISDRTRRLVESHEQYLWYLAIQRAGRPHRP